MAIAPLTDLLPSLFDSAVLRLTRRPLLSAERNAILTALVNGIGEAVTRRVHQATTVEPASSTEGADVEAAESKSVEPNTKDITEIETFDRFSDEWISRVEIVHGIENSSGLDHDLSEFALFLMESRLDSILAAGNSSVVGLGEISPGRSVHEIRPTSQEVLNRLEKAFAESLSAVSGSLGVWLLLLGRQEQYLAKRLIDQSQLIASLREPLSYKIVLAETLAYKSDNRSPKEINIAANEKNRVIEPRPLVDHNPPPGLVLPAQVQPVPQRVLT